MRNHEIKIDSGAVQTTLSLPLFAGAKELEKYKPVVCDIFALDVV
jgi:hypothetical protein